MQINLWISTFTTILLGITLTTQLALAQPVNRKQRNYHPQKVNTTRTHRQITKYWTRKRMRRAKPIMPTVNKLPDSGNPSPPENTGEKSPNTSNSGAGAKVK
ncbi:hypothetical protein [Calothrix sp. 336/3]|uniref:hypothetical protein n=1 Tax=Calothrix sp. 336/3 TaxID=1337936 RepID=UPI0004E38383|nr:hypothetical protein [Calothrix sp. 336/3]AKG20419.1 hypothetical protein IJ00_02955 [Calothrix sp. 336/3]